MFNGYNYDTPTQINGINARHGVGMCQASPDWRKRALEEFRKSVELGASGTLFDECQWHMSPYCFSTHHGHGMPAAVFSGDVPLIEEFRGIIDEEIFLFAGESPYDLELQTYGMSYFRIERGFVPFARYLDPFAPMSVAVTGWNDRQMPLKSCALLYAKRCEASCSVLRFAARSGGQDYPPLADVLGAGLRHFGYEVRGGS